MSSFAKDALLVVALMSHDKASLVTSMNPSHLAWYLYSAPSAVMERDVAFILSILSHKAGYQMTKPQRKWMQDIERRVHQANNERENVFNAYERCEEAPDMLHPALQ